MQISHAALISTLSFAPAMLYGQAGPAAPPAPAQAKPVSAILPAQPAATSPAPAPASTLLQPALHDVEDTLTSLKFDRWKKGSIRDEAASNTNAILGDLKVKMPPLLAQTDAANGTISQTVPLVKHLDALYDVLLRVEEASRISAPGDQIDQLESALRKLELARIAVYDSMQQRAAGQEKQVADLQQTIKTQQQEAAAAEDKRKSAPEAKAQPCTPPKPAVKKKKPAPKTTPPANGQPAQNPPAPAKPQQAPQKPQQ